MSEFVPLTILFFVITFFNISFTSGKINGFVFFAQVVVMFHVTANDFIKLPGGVGVLKRILHFFYSIFNLDMFMLDEFSFCLFKDATALDVIALNYVTLLYSFMLIIRAVFLLNKVNMRCLIKFSGKHRRTFQGSIIHGLTAFLVLCYAKCTQASLLIISYASIQGKGGTVIDMVVFYNGDITWFSNQHLPYAIPAIVMMIVLVIAITPTCSPNLPSTF